MRWITITIALALAACATPQSKTVSHLPRDTGGDTARATRPVPPPADATTAESAGPALQQEAVQMAEPPDDVWKRIQAGLLLDRHVDQRSVQDKMAWYQRNQDYLDRVSDRARPYLYYVVSELERRNMPLDLALLPVIESAYHPFAYSPSRASGIWQFIPSTGKRYGLKQDWWYDGRRDIVASTRAALDYLQTLNQEFDGNWLLAVAAYNAGELNVSRAIAQNRRAGRKTDFWSLNLPRETRGYVPSLLAVAELVAHPDAHGVAWHPIPNQPFFKRVALDGQLDLATAARLADISIDEIYTLNPGFNQWATDPDGDGYLLVPVDSAQHFSDGLAALPEEERVKWTRHVIDRGETLSVIAARYHTSIEALKEANNLHSSLIHTGNALLIPNARLPSTAYTLSMANRRYRGLKRTDDGHQFIYQVTRGDTLWDIGRQYGVSVRELCAWNGISPRSVLHLGQRLKLRVRSDDGSTVSVSLRSRSGDVASYTVRQGDSLWVIARRFGVSVDELQKWNELDEDTLLQPGQTLQIYTPAVAETGA